MSREMSARKLFILHLAANALLLWLGYLWLGVAESTQLRLVASAFEALAILTLACWLHGATLVFFRNGEGAFRRALRHLPALVAAAIVVLALYGLLAWAAAASGQPAFRLASWLTLKLRTPVKPANIARIFLAGFWIVRWIVLPVALLPMASGIAKRGWRGFAEFTWRGGWRRWLQVPLLLVAGLLLPFILLAWVPAAGNFTLEMVSFSLRILAAYLLFVGALWRLEQVSSYVKTRPAR